MHDADVTYERKLYKERHYASRTKSRCKSRCDALSDTHTLVEYKCIVDEKDVQIICTECLLTADFSRAVLTIYAYYLV